MAVTLILLNGPTPGATIRLEPNSTLVRIGRDASCELPIDDQLCSRLHAQVRFSGERWNIEDCGSRNGTLLNSQPIQQSTLEMGDVIRIGDRLIAFVEANDQHGSRSATPGLIGSTFVARVSEPGKREAMLQQLRSDSPSRPVHDAAVLCRLASRLYAQTNVAGLIRLTIETLQQAIAADRVAIFLVGADGRLRSVGSSRPATAPERDPHLLASLALANDEAILVQHSVDPSSQHDSAVEQPGTESGSSISVPIPGRTTRRGAIECQRNPGSGPFTRDDLDLVIAATYQIGLALENIESREQLELANAHLREAIDDHVQFVGRSSAMANLAEQLGRVAPTTSTVLVLGESGTGKELVAQLIHRASPRQLGPCVAVNCAAFTESLLDSELFGHEKGAFTGADRRRLGQLERANHGTLFLDEIGEMSLACQAKLLRVLEGHTFERVGGTEPIRVDVRTVAATHRDLSELAAKGDFRQDLYYRLRVIELRVPPLRDRGDDILELAVHFLRRFRAQIGRGPIRLSEQAADAMMQYRWPGNVRELRNSIERAVVLGSGDEVQIADLGIPIIPGESCPDWGPISLEAAELRHIQNVLDQVGGNKTRACEILGIGRATLYKKLGKTE